MMNFMRFFQPAALAGKIIVKKKIFLQRLSRDFSEISIDFSFSKISKILLLIRKTISSK